jgi:putative sporulation protein YyaC
LSNNDLSLNDESLNVLLKIRMTDKPKVFLCIGTPKHVWDSYGPMVGSLLRENKKDIICLGTMDNPVNSYNVERTELIIKEKYPDHMIIAIDGAVTNSKDRANQIWIMEGGFKPGQAYSKDLREIGDYSILFAIDSDDMESKDHTKPFKAAMDTFKIIKKLLE